MCVHVCHLWPPLVWLRVGGGREQWASTLVPFLHVASDLVEGLPVWELHAGCVRVCEIAQSGPLFWLQNCPQKQTQPPGPGGVQ